MIAETILVVLGIVAAAAIFGAFLAARTPTERVETVDADCARDPNAFGTAEHLGAATSVLIHDVKGEDYGSPATVLILVPSDAGTEVRWVVDPDSYDDVTDFTATLSRIAKVLSSRQGQINKDLHVTRINRGEGK